MPSLWCTHACTLTTEAPNKCHFTEGCSVTTQYDVQGAWYEGEGTRATLWACAHLQCATWGSCCELSGFIQTLQVRGVVSSLLSIDKAISSPPPLRLWWCSPTICLITSRCTPCVLQLPTCCAKSMSSSVSGRGISTPGPTAKIKSRQ